MYTTYKVKNENNSGDSKSRTTGNFTKHLTIAYVMSQYVYDS